MIMPSPASAPDATTRLRSAIDIGALALGTLIAVGVAAVFLILPGAHRTSYAPRPAITNAHPAAPRPLFAQGVAKGHDMHRHISTATAMAAFVMGSPATVAVSRATPPPRVAPGHGPYATAGSTTRPSRPDQADWAKIKTAASLRRLALAPHRTSRFRAFAAVLGLSELVSIHPLAPGRCLTAVTAVYNNLLDLENAYPGENWGPLRRAVAKEASIDACAPRPPRQDGA
jgi:hypothetical protein